MLKVALDTNVLVSSLLVKAGLPAQVLDAWRARRYLLIISPVITLEYPRIRLKYAISDGDVEALITLLERDALLVPGDADLAGAVPGDPADEMVLACAVQAKADLIVSGDRHLLDLGAYRSIPVLTALQELERLEAASSELPLH